MGKRGENTKIEQKTRTLNHTHCNCQRQRPRRDPLPVERGSPGLSSRFPGDPSRQYYWKPELLTRTLRCEPTRRTLEASSCIAIMWTLQSRLGRWKTKTQPPPWCGSTQSLPWPWRVA